MITKEEFEQAEQVIVDYKRQLNKSLIVNKVCVCCRNKEIKPIEGMGLSEGYIKATEQEKGCWGDGTVERVTFGFGSRYDTRSYYIAICDDCVQQLEKDGLIVNIKKLIQEEAKYGI